MDYTLEQMKKENKIIKMGRTEYLPYVLTSHDPLTRVFFQYQFVWFWLFSPQTGIAIGGKHFCKSKSLQVPSNRMCNVRKT